MAPELIAEFVRVFQEETVAAARAATLRGGDLKREAEGVQRKMAGVMAAIEDGMCTPAPKDRMKALEQRKAEIESLLVGADAPAVIRIHPNMAEIYRLKVPNSKLPSMTTASRPRPARSCAPSSTVLC